MAEELENWVGEEGEEEDQMEVDPVLDDVKSEFSASVVQSAPALLLGSLARVEAPAPKPKRKRKVTDEVEDLDADILEEGSTPQDTADPEIMAVTRLRILVNDLGKVPNCFYGLVPSIVLREKEKIGKQLRGVGGSKNIQVQDSKML